MTAKSSTCVRADFAKPYHAAGVKDQPGLQTTACNALGESTVLHPMIMGQFRLQVDDVRWSRPQYTAYHIRRLAALLDHVKAKQYHSRPATTVSICTDFKNGSLHLSRCRPRLHHRCRQCLGSQASRPLQLRYIVDSVVPEQPQLHRRCQPHRYHLVGPHDHGRRCQGLCCHQ